MSNFDLSRRTAIFELHLWVVIFICTGAAVLLLLLCLLLLCYSLLRKNASSRKTTIPIISKEIEEVRIEPSNSPKSSSLSSPAIKHKEDESPIVISKECAGSTKEQIITYPEQGGGGGAGVGSSLVNQSANQAAATAAAPEITSLGWGQWFTLSELEVATDSFSRDNVIGEGGYGIVYHGVMEDGTEIAAKNLLNNKGQAETEFKGEVEAIGRVRHKNLVRLLGYCAEGAHRILVYEYLHNGNLEKWLHGDVGPSSPLTWDIRMKIMLGTAKGLLYLHEGLDPKVVHRDIKSSNILLDKEWTPKLSDFGLAKLMGTGRTYVTTRVMGTFGYVAPEYASTGMLNETSDVYSFGILIMETITGRRPVDYSRPPGEVNLIEWIKNMVSSRKTDEVIDPRMPEKPSSRTLKKTLLVALRCVDPDSQQRPKMGHVIHMLEVDDFLYQDDRRTGRLGRSYPESPRQ
ncbi:putative serine/threonine-protein kinase [Canna indica]|uniref:non-specific serine/threonine protein kinase n=1 Tax=Canna indica TaxID=4628 RepID=A0AAQ3Q7U3_9LILI|nr:putative serine/threonine-protein kinase [Canna indica]